jgi:hypothetical protein
VLSGLLLGTYPEIDSRSIRALRDVTKAQVVMGIDLGAYRELEGKVRHLVTKTP